VSKCSLNVHFKCSPLEDEQQDEKDAQDELRLGPRLCLAAYRVARRQVLEHRAVEIAENESNPDANGTLQHLLRERGCK